MNSLECQKFLEKPFANYYPDSWYYNYVLIPFCGNPDYEKHFACLGEAKKKNCLDMVNGKTRFIKTRFVDDCLCKERDLVSRRIQTVKKIPKPISGWKKFFSFWKNTNIETEKDILIPILEHKDNLIKQVRSGSGFFLLVGNAFLLHTFPNLILYDPFFDNQKDFDIEWFGQVHNLSGHNYLNTLYTYTIPFIYLKEEKVPVYSWKPEKSNFDQFQFTVKAEFLHVRLESTTVTINRKYDLKNKEFFVLPLLMFIQGVGKHFNLLVYDIRKQTWEHFESNGYISFMSDYLDDYLEENLTKMFANENEPNGKFFVKKFIRTKEITPTPCFQQLDIHGKDPKIDMGDYCASWSYWFMNIRLRNKNHTAAYIVKKIIHEFEVERKVSTYLNFIRSFAILIGKVCDELDETFSFYFIKSWFKSRKEYEDQVNEILRYYIKEFFQDPDTSPLPKEKKLMAPTLKSKTLKITVPKSTKNKISKDKISSLENLKSKLTSIQNKTANTEIISNSRNNKQIRKYFQKENHQRLEKMPSLLVKKQIMERLSLNKTKDLTQAILPLLSSPNLKKNPAWNHFIVRYLAKQQGVPLKEKYWNKIKLFTSKLFKTLLLEKTIDKKLDKLLQFLVLEQLIDEKTEMDVRKKYELLKTKKDKKQFYERILKSFL